MTVETAKCASKVVAAAVLCRSRWLEDGMGASLQSAGIAVERHRNVLTLVNALQSGKADIAVVEDEGDHFESCMSALRFRGTSPVPLIAIGGGSSEAIAAALRRGASDYMVVGEAAHTFVARLLARVTLHRESAAPSSLRLGLCELDSATRVLSWPQGEVVLTWREFNIAWLLFEHASQVVHLRTLSSQVWGRDISVAKRTIEQHVSRLRQKLAMACAATNQRLLLHAVHNLGYRLTLEPAERTLATQTRAATLACGTPPPAEFVQ